MATGCSLHPALRYQKGRPHGARHGKTDAQKKHSVVHNARRRCIKKSFDGIHDRFQRDPVHRDSQLKIGWTEENCIAMDELAQEDHSYRLPREEFKRYQGQHPTLNRSGKNASMRSDFRPAVAIKNRLHRESGEERAEPIPFQHYQRWRPSSSSDSWWNWDTSKSWWSS